MPIQLGRRSYIYKYSYLLPTNCAHSGLDAHFLPEQTVSSIAWVASVAKHTSVACMNQTDNQAHKDRVAMKNLIFGLPSETAGTSRGTSSGTTGTQSGHLRQRPHGVGQRVQGVHPQLRGEP